MAEVQALEVESKRPFTGSCHCGAVRYIVYLTMPPKQVPLVNGSVPRPRNFQHIYRCNCTTCHKAGVLHVRLASAPDDFLLLSPTDPVADLADYTCFSQRLHFYFCKTCGMRCFIFHGEGEVKEEEVNIGQTQGKLPVWRPKKEGWVEGSKDYLSVNGYTIDAGQEGLDLREWTESKSVLYLDVLGASGVKEPSRYDRPHVGGAY